jgi:hypothetical protein
LFRVLTLKAFSSSIFDRRTLSCFTWRKRGGETTMGDNMRYGRKEEGRILWTFKRMKEGIKGGTEMREWERERIRELEDERVTTLHIVTPYFIVTTFHIPVIMVWHLDLSMTWHNIRRCDATWHHTVWCDMI